MKLGKKMKMRREMKGRREREREGMEGGGFNSGPPRRMKDPNGGGGAGKKWCRQQWRVRNKSHDVN